MYLHSIQKTDLEGLVTLIEGDKCSCKVYVAKTPYVKQCIDPLSRPGTSDIIIASRRQNLCVNVGDIVTVVETEGATFSHKIVRVRADLCWDYLNTNIIY